MKPSSFDFARATSLDEASGLLEAGGEGARPYAGGQSLGPMLNFRLAQPSLLVDLSAVGALRINVLHDDFLEVGAMTVHADFEDGKIADVSNGLMRYAASGIAYRAVRNRGTIGGSLSHADPAADWPPVLMVLDAIARINSKAGGYEVPLSRFITGNLATVLSHGEILQSVKVPRVSPGAVWGHYKVCVKPGDFAESLAVVLLDRERNVFRTVLAGPENPAIYLEKVTDLLRGSKSWSEKFGDQIKATAIEDVIEAGFVNATDTYNVNLHGTVVSRAVRRAMTK